ncbi:hypothetical protein OHR68_40925 [Spirillospora sp. NBC_00431]
MTVGLAFTLIPATSGAAFADQREEIICWDVDANQHPCEELLNPIVVHPGERLYVAVRGSGGHPIYFRARARGAWIGNWKGPIKVHDNRVHLYTNGGRHNVYPTVFAKSRKDDDVGLGVDVYATAYAE